MKPRFLLAPSSLLLASALLLPGCATPAERARPKKLEFVQQSRPSGMNREYYRQVEPSPRDSAQ